MKIQFIRWRFLAGALIVTVWAADRSARIADVYPVLIRKGRQESKRGDFALAREFFQRALTFVRNSEESERAAFCLKRIGNILWNDGKLEDASRCYREAMALIQGLSGKEEEKRFFLNAQAIYEDYKNAKALRNSGDYKQSIETFRKAISRARMIGSPEHEVKCLRQLSICYWEKNQLKSYFELNSEAQAIAAKNALRKEEGICLNNIGLYYWKLNRFSLALDFYDRALHIAYEIEDELLSSQVQSNLSVLYNEFGDYDRALVNLESVRDIEEKANIKIFLPIDFNNLGVIQKNIAVATNNKSFFIKALNNFSLALDLSRIAQNHKTDYYFLNNMGEVYSYLGEFKKAIDVLSEGRKLAYKESDSYLLGYLDNNIGNTLYLSGDYNRAIEYFLSSISYGRSISDDRILWETYYGLALCYEKLNNNTLALESYQKSLDAIDRIRSQIHVDSYKTGFAKSKVKIFESLIGLLLRLREKAPSEKIDEAIFTYVEKARARAFLECLAESRVDIKEKLDPNLRNEEVSISAEISSLIAELGRPGNNELLRRELRPRLEQKEEDYLRLISKMRTANPEIVNLVLPEICGLGELRTRLLFPDTILIEYYLAEPRSLMAMIDTNGIRVYSLPSRTAIVNSVKGFIKYLWSGDSRRWEGQVAARRIGELLLFPLNERRYSGKKSLIIVPDNILHYLPFETLSLEGENMGDRYLIENYQISYIPSVSILKYLLTPNDRVRIKEGLLALGDPSDPPYLPEDDSAETNESSVAAPDAISLENHGRLPFSREEIDTISKHFSPQRRKLFLGSDANETAIKDLSGHEFDVIHFACHSFLDLTHPMRSALLLAPSKTGIDDGFLEVRELYNLRLSAELVVLSSCRTAHGLMESLEGIMGLPRIFFYIGARSVLSTLWPIEDRSSAMFMDRFYSELGRGWSKAKALQLAKIALIHSFYQHPRYWAAFILNGDPWSSIDTEN